MYSHCHLLAYGHVNTRFSSCVFARIAWIFAMDMCFGLFGVFDGRVCLCVCERARVFHMQSVSVFILEIHVQLWCRHTMRDDSDWQNNNKKKQRKKRFYTICFTHTTWLQRKNIYRKSIEFKRKRFKGERDVDERHEQKKNESLFAEWVQGARIAHMFVQFCGLRGMAAGRWYALATTMLCYATGMHVCYAVSTDITI